MMMENKVSKISTKVDQNFMWWNSSAGNNVNSSQASGAYVFRPNRTALFEVNGSIVKTKVIDVSCGESEEGKASSLYNAVLKYSEQPMYLIGSAQRFGHQGL